MNQKFLRSITTSILTAALVSTSAPFLQAQKQGKVLTGQGAMGDWSTDAPGVWRHITTADMPKAYESPSVNNGPRLVKRPEGAMPKVPDGFKVEEFVSGLRNPRLIRTAPNGDLFVAESQANLIRVFRQGKSGDKPDVNEVFSSDLKQPFGIAFYPLGPNPQYIYVGNTESIVRFPYKNGDLKASGKPEVVVPDIPSGARLTGGGHWTRDIAFTRDGKKMLVSVGSRSNVNENLALSEKDRADVLEFNPDGTGRRIYASGIRNAVGI